MKPVPWRNDEVEHLEALEAIDYSLYHIRPMAVSPLIHSERVPNPWGFSFSARVEIAAMGAMQ